MAAAVTVLSACAVGPDFDRPETVEVQRYTALPLPDSTEAAPMPQGEAQRFVAGGEIPAQWWKLFGSRDLERVISQALEQSPDLAAEVAGIPGRPLHREHGTTKLIDQGGQD